MDVGLKDTRPSVENMRAREWRTAVTAGCTMFVLAIAGMLLLELGANVGMTEGPSAVPAMTRTAPAAAPPQGAIRAFIASRRNLQNQAKAE